MVEKALRWGWVHLRPAGGWLPFLLLLTIALTLVIAVLAVSWVPEDGIVGWAAFLGLLLATVLANRPLSWLPAWLLLLSYGLVIIITVLGRLIPPSQVIVSGWGSISDYIRQNWGLFIDRIGGWLEAVLGDGRSEETIVFALGLGLLTWLLFAYAGWSVYRQHRPLAGVTLIGIALAANSYYGRIDIWPLAAFISLAAILVSLTHYADQERNWDNEGVDYSGEIRIDLVSFSGVIALSLFLAAYIVPALNLQAISRAILDRTAVHEAEDTLSQAFAGVRQPQQEPLATDIINNPDVAGGGMPRSFLLGNPPELYETVVMTATVDGDYPTTTHWRGLSYDLYTGRGWAISTERQEPIAPNQAIPLPSWQRQTAVNQTVNWVSGDTTSRYTLGLPTQFDQDVVTYWRGLEDLSRVQGQGNHYRASSQVADSLPSELREVSLSDVPPAILARYTVLPDSIPDRVHELAREVVGNHVENSQVTLSAYDQAKALELFLRQYPYSLEVELPPPDSDPVDYFLFDLQSGYCDYYASAMVVMARSLGLPARLASGFLAQPADANGQQTIYQINAHSWAEVYFAGHGWVEFEPTAAFPAGDQELILEGPSEEGLGDLFADFTPPPIPGSTPRRPSPLWLILLILPLGLGGWLLWRRRQRPISKTDGTHWAYGRLLHRAQTLGQPTPPSQTPSEFEVAFISRLQGFEGRLVRRLQPGQLFPEIMQLTSLFLTSQYGKTKPPAEPAVRSWRKIRGRLWLLGFLRRLNQLVSRSAE